MSLSKIALLGLAAVAGMAQAANFELTIMHTNDVHARVSSTDEKGEYVTRSFKPLVSCRVHIDSDPNCHFTRPLCCKKQAFK